MWLYILIGLLIALAVIVFCACIVGARADRQIEEFMRDEQTRSIRKTDK